MYAADIALTVVAAIAYAYAAVLNFTHNKSVAKTAERLGAPSVRMVWLGSLTRRGLDRVGGGRRSSGARNRPASGPSAILMRSGCPHPSTRYPDPQLGQLDDVFLAGCRRAGGRLGLARSPNRPYAVPIRCCLVVTTRRQARRCRPSSSDVYKHLNSRSQAGQFPAEEASVQGI